MQGRAWSTYSWGFRTGEKIAADSHNLGRRHTRRTGSKSHKTHLFVHTDYYGAPWLHHSHEQTRDSEWSCCFENLSLFLSNSPGLSQTFHKLSFQLLGIELTVMRCTRHLLPPTRGPAQPLHTPLYKVVLLEMIKSESGPPGMIYRDLPGSATGGTNETWSSCS